ncbi:MAG TPA: hypothetical protein G4O05_00960 [Caldilineae bacterium]|nr:hypothetical protein [Caldilineae bacterium]
MLVLNFAHTLTEEHLKKIEELTGQPVGRVIAVDSHIDPEEPLLLQVKTLADRVGLSSEEWQTLPILVNPPALNFSAVTLVAELHGRMGYFPPILRIKPVEGAVPPKFEVAEIIDLQIVRDRARRERGG